MADCDVINCVRGIVGRERAFDEHVPGPVVERGPEEDADDVLDAALADGDPVRVMGTAVTPFVWDPQAVVEQRRTGEARRVTDWSDNASLTNVAGRVRSV